MLAINDIAWLLLSWPFPSAQPPQPQAFLQNTFLCMFNFVLNDFTAGTPISDRNYTQIFTTEIVVETISVVEGGHGIVM